MDPPLKGNAAWEPARWADRCGGKYMGGSGKRGWAPSSESWPQWAPPPPNVLQAPQHAPFITNNLLVLPHHASVHKNRNRYIDNKDNNNISIYDSVQQHKSLC